MIEYFKYRLKLARLLRQKENVRNSFTKDIRMAQNERKPKEDIESLEYQSYFEESVLDEEISILATDNLICKARRHFVLIPPHDTKGMWEKCEKISNRYVLTSKGISLLRSSLRKERKQQFTVTNSFFYLSTIHG